MRDAIIKLVNEVAKMNAEILRMINEFPKQVVEVVSKEILVIKRTIIKDLWKVVASKGSAAPTPHNIEDIDEDKDFSVGEKVSFGEEEDVFGEEDDDVEDDS